MFKLPQLQPQLTGNNGVERSKSASTYNPFSSSSTRRYAPPGGEEAQVIANSAFEVKGWESLAKEITHDVTQSDKYKSIALHAEVKLAEALEKSARVCPTTHAPGGEERPNKLKTAVCCQLLGEFAGLCGPFSSVLKNIRDELLKSTYSWYYVSERGALVFDQLPWFTVAERLEREKEVMAIEREQFKSALQEQQDAIMRIEEQVGTYQRAMVAAREETESMKRHLESLTSSEELARIEAKTGREELKRARKDWMKMRDELASEKEAHAQLKVASDQNMTYMSKQVSEANKAAEAAHRETRDMQHALNMRPPPEELESLKDKMKALREALKEGEDASRQRIRDLEKEKANLMERLGSMTPRPSWEPVKKHGVEIGSKTQDTVFAAAARLAEFVSDQKDLASKAQLLEALLAPDPLPYEVSLTITTDSSAYFITEEEGDEKERAPSQAEGLGLAPSVSRCLRWAKGEKITLAHFTLARLEDAILQIWKAKRVYDRSHVGQPLHSYLYTFYLAALGQTPTGSTAHQRVAASTYSLYAACADHAQSSATVRLFWAVLSGLVSEEVQKEQALMVTALRHMVSRLPLAVLPAEAAPSEATPTEPAGTEGDVASSSQEDAPAQALLSPEERAAPRVSSQDVLDILDAMFPSRVSYKLNKLKEALTLQFRGETIILAHLLAALEPHVLPPLLGGAHSPVVTDEDDEHLEMGEFVATLLEQHLTDVESQSSDALAKLAATEAAPLPETSAASIDPATTVISIASAMASLQDAGVDEQGVVASVARALDLNFPLQGDQSSALKMVLEMLAPAVLETASFCTSLQQQCMLRCSPTYDLEKATSLGDRKIAAAAQG